MTPVFDLPNHLILLQIVCYPHPIVKNSQEFSVKVSQSLSTCLLNVLLFSLNTWNIFQFLDGFKRSLFVTKANNLLCFFAPIPEIVCSSASVALLRLIFPPDFAGGADSCGVSNDCGTGSPFGHVNNHLIFYF